MGWLALCGWLVALMAILAWRRALAYPRVVVAPPIVIREPAQEPPAPPARRAKRRRWHALRAKMRAWRTAASPVALQPTVGGPAAWLYAADGTLESVRRIKGAPPKEITRAHGRAAATVYTRVRQDADRWIYQAES